MIDALQRIEIVAHVDDAQTSPGQVVPDRLDVPSLKAEHAIDAALDQEFDDPLSYRTGFGSFHFHSTKIELSCSLCSA